MQLLIFIAFLWILTEGIVPPQIKKHFLSHHPDRGTLPRRHHHRTKPSSDPSRHGPFGNFLSGRHKSETFISTTAPDHHKAHQHLGRFGKRDAEEIQRIGQHLGRLRARHSAAHPAALHQQKQEKLEKLKDKLLDTHPVLSIHEINQNAGIDHFLFESDLALTETQAKALADAPIGQNGKRAAGAATAHLWDKTKPIPYTFNSSMDDERIHIVERALISWENETCLRFEKNAIGPNRLEFFVGAGCYSSVGRIDQWEKQPISLGDGCQMVGIASHEIMHSLGVYHTHGRTDRDANIIVNSNSVQSQMLGNFLKLTIKENDNKGIGFDYGSIMHYGSYYFWNGKDSATIVAEDVRYQNTIGNRREIQFSDSKMINSIYKCNEHCTKHINCWNSGYIDPKDCTRCKCPSFFKGKFCEMSQVITHIKHDEMKTIKLAAEEIPSNHQFTTDNVDYDDFTKSVPEVIQSDEGHRLTLRIVDFPTTPLKCYAACRYAGIEIVDGDFEKSGIVICCSKEKNSTFHSKTNRVGIRAWAAPGIPLQYIIKAEADKV
ncbi:unnamed protein product, partial [Mesorhabditis belari]|uniref:Metalloendopeptidase n=1 Tax=Mesorhabditis belari TaxID=2138241 RepID=A0AAF3FIG9_9BILA